MINNNSHDILTNYIIITTLRKAPDYHRNNSLLARNCQTESQGVKLSHKESFGLRRDEYKTTQLDETLFNHHIKKSPIKVY